MASSLLAAQTSGFENDSGKVQGLQTLSVETCCFDRRTNLMPKGARRRPERLAEKLCHIRHRLKLTQEELKERLEQLGFVSDLDRADVSDFERGRRDPDLLTLLSYGRLANVYLDALVDDELDIPEDASPCAPL